VAIRDTVLLAALVAFGAQAAPPAAAPSLLLWHNQDEVQTRFLEKLVRDFDPRVRVEGTLELEKALLDRAALGTAPVAALVPSDLLSLHKEFALSEVPAAARDPGVATLHYEALKVNGKVYGLPILDGNHIALLYNKSIVSKPARSWTEIKAQMPEFRARNIKAAGWFYEEPFFFLPMLRAFGGPLLPLEGTKLDTPGLRRALDFYRSLSRDGIIPIDCGFDCSMDRFGKGEFAYAIGGEWSFLELSQKMSGKLGVAALPEIDGRPVRPFRSSLVMIFPNRSLEGPLREPLLKLAAYLQGVGAQTRWQEEAWRMPVNSKVPPSSNPILKTSREILATATPLPRGLQMHYYWRAIGRAIKAVLHDNATGAEGAKRAQDWMSSATARRTGR
jgi:maltose-binding protein MalE